jgi:hypothetical protein
MKYLQELCLQHLMKIRLSIHTNLKEDGPTGYNFSLCSYSLKRSLINKTCILLEGEIVQEADI